MNINPSISEQSNSVSTFTQPSPIKLPSLIFNPILDNELLLWNYNRAIALIYFNSPPPFALYNVTTNQKFRASVGENW